MKTDGFTWSCNYYCSIFLQKCGLMTCKTPNSAIIEVEASKMHFPHCTCNEKFPWSYDSDFPQKRGLHFYTKNERSIFLKNKMKWYDHVKCVAYLRVLSCSKMGWKTISIASSGPKEFQNQVLLYHCKRSLLHYHMIPSSTRLPLEMYERICLLFTTATLHTSGEGKWTLLYNILCFPWQLFFHDHITPSFCRETEPPSSGKIVESYKHGNSPITDEWQNTLVHCL